VFYYEVEGAGQLREELAGALDERLLGFYVQLGGVCVGVGVHSFEIINCQLK
jgi:hypothetical protein